MKKTNIILWVGVALAAFLLFGNRIKMMLARTGGTRTVSKTGNKPLQSQTPDLQSLGMQAGAALAGLLARQSPAYNESATAAPIDTGPAFTFGDFGGLEGLDIDYGTNPTVFDNTGSTAFDDTLIA